MTRSPRLLVVDDDHAVTDMIEAFLVGTGLSVGTIARTGEEAISAVRRDRFDVAVIDLQLPGTSGPDLLRALRELDPDLRLVICSAHAAGSTQIAGVRALADRILPKHDLAKLPDHVRELCADDGPESR